MFVTFDRMEFRAASVTLAVKTMVRMVDCAHGKGNEGEEGRDGKVMGNSKGQGDTGHGTRTTPIHNGSSRLCTTKAIRPFAGEGKLAFAGVHKPVTGQQQDAA